jgi:ABC-type enterochelin transport system permease subunit
MSRRVPFLGKDKHSVMFLCLCEQLLNLYGSSIQRGIGNKGLQKSLEVWLSTGFQDVLDDREYVWGTIRTIVSQMIVSNQFAYLGSGLTLSFRDAEVGQLVGNCTNCLRVEGGHVENKLILVEGSEELSGRIFQHLRIQNRLEILIAGVSNCIIGPQQVFLVKFCTSLVIEESGTLDYFKRRNDIGG